MIKMKIELIQIYNKPYYRITYGEKTENAFGFEQVKKYVTIAKQNDEKIELVDLVLKEHSKLVALLNSNKIQKKKSK